MICVPLLYSYSYNVLELFVFLTLSTSLISDVEPV
jgi:hypothetical protein